MRIITALCFMVACSPAVSENPLPVFDSPELKVEALTVSRKQVSFIIRGDGKVAALKGEDLYFEQPGKIKELRYHTGQWVKEGDTLMILDNRNEYLDLQLAELRYREAGYAYESAMMSYHATGSLTDTIRQSILYSSGKAEAAIRRQQARLMFEAMYLKAGLTGRLFLNSIAEGSRVNGGELLGTIHQPSGLIIECHLLELHLPTVYLGMKVALTDMSGRTFEGKVSAIDARVNEDGFFRAIIKPFQTTLLTPGMHVGVELFVQYHEAFAIPSKAILKGSERLFVYVLRDETATWQYISTGIQMGNLVEVTEGLNEGDTVLLTGLSEVDHGVRVKIREILN